MKWGASMTGNVYLVSGGSAPSMVVTDRVVAVALATALGAEVQEVSINDVQCHVWAYLDSIGHNVEYLRGLLK